MGYYAIMIDIKQAEEEIAEKIDEWMTQICQMNAVLSSYCTDLQERCSGELVDAICCYVKDVYQELLEQFMILFIEMQERIVCYAEGYYEIEDDIGTGEIAQWSLENQKLILQNEKESFFLETEELEKYLSEISDIISMDAPSTTAVESGFGELTKYADDLLTTIGEYEEKHKSEDFEVMEEMIDSLSKLIEDLSGKKQVELREYKSEDILKHPEVERLKTVDDEFFSLRESDKKRLEIMEEYHLQQQIEERKNQGKLKFLNGVLLVAGAVGTIAVVVVSMGGATPAVAGIWGNIIIGGSSTMTTIYGVSETIEGINLYELGKEGDVQTVAGNPVRDIVFGGDEKLYHKWGEANVLISQFTMGGSSLVNLAKSQGINAAMLEVGKIAGSGVVGDMAYQYMVEEAGMSEVDAMLLGMVTSELTYGGLNLLHGNVLSRQNVNTVKGGTDVIKNNLVNKVKDIRAKMPNTNLSKRGNMAVADVDVPGIKDNFVAHSKINAELDKGADVADFSYLKPENERIFTSYVDDQYPRYHDTEAKILEDIASQITDPNVSGTINLYSELPCCQSCSNIILEFRRMFPNIELNIFVE